MKFNRIWCMPNKHTFLIKPIQEIIERYVGKGNNWIDPFSGFNSPAEITNDLNPEAPTKYHLKALEFAKKLDSCTYDGCIFDPPYSLRQIKECYNKFGMKLTQEDSWDASFGKVKSELAPKIKTNGIVISCGWSTNGFGINRGFKIIEILLVPHGGHHNDTIITVEERGCL